MIPLLTGVSMAFTYVMFYLVLPRFLFNPQTRSVRLLIVVFIYLLVLMFYLDTLIIFGFFYRSIMMGPPIKNTATNIHVVTLGIIFIPLLASMIKIFQHWSSEEKAALALKHEKTQAELSQLKSQINPHFLFNTLNSLYALSLKKSDQAPEAILKLSGILSYLLYDCTAEKVSIQKEIQLLQDYITLEQFRYENRLDIDVDISITDHSLQIPPMLLLPFVENSFKHCVSRKRTNVFVSIRMWYQDFKIYFEVKNPLFQENSEQQKNMGIGIENVRKRLDLLFGDNYALNININSQFCVLLSFPVDQGAG